jgi:hypothetical protein
MHIGWRKQGNVQYTRPYITGNVLWGALAARMTRDGFFGDYGAAGTFVDEQLGVSYLYLSDCPDRVTAYPWTPGAADKFAWKYMGSYSSTALADGYVKEDGSLHEIEFLAPASRPDGEPVYAVGCVFAALPDNGAWRKSLARLDLGGERSYGWGRCQLVAVQPCDRPGAVLPGIAEVRLDGARPLVSVDGGATLAHVDACLESECEGELEPLVGRVTNPSNGYFGVQHSDAVISWRPGARIPGRRWFSVGRRGVWSFVKEP